ncbi:CHASE domain-containing protein [Thiomicrorhabdus arctica]|uniref:CHASE domain-containing protein n=1 Tax=Thiomicrorhabdus arctica TaxID=131540 RepID=UPI0009FEC556|nr:CHASE domain-containing protein [Thiomicrorhabdus arctica]
MVGILALGLSYALVGYISLLLAIPPGYATAIFPSAGIALAALLLWGYRLLPGVFLGSLLLNLWVTLEHSPLTLTNLEFITSASIGATLQALAGAWLVRRFVGFPTTLSKGKDIVSFMILTGPVASIISAIFGVTGLYATGIISLSDYTYSWLTWWIGDTIGVLITVPLILIAFAQPKPLWRGRIYSVALPLLFMLTIIIVLFFWVSELESGKAKADFKEVSNDTHEKLRSSFENYQDSVIYIERFFSSSSNVSRVDFRNFVDHTLNTKPGINGFSWNPIVSETQREQFEKNIREEGFADFKITQRNNQGQLITANNRDEYIPVKYIEPMSGNEKAFGFDVASNSARRAALLQAQLSGKIIATERITLVQENGNQAGFLLSQPVYKGGRHATLEERKKNLIGFVVGVFRVDDIVNAVLQDHSDDQFIVSINDVNTKTSTHLYGPDTSQQFEKAVFKITNTLDVGGRQWRVNYWASPSFLTTHRGWQAWAALASGLVFTSIFGAFLLAMSGRSFQIENLVTRRTAELSGILNSAIEAIMTINENGHIESINPAGEALFGYSSVEISGQSISMIVPELLPQSESESDVSRLFTLSGSRRDSYAVRKDSTRLPVELAISTLDVNDKTLYTVIIHDLTERTKVDRMKDEFISTVSHELRTPLTSIKGSLGLILGGILDKSPEKLKEMLAISYENCGRLEQLINGLLDFNKNQSLDTPLQTSLIEINTLLDKAVLYNQGYADKYGVSYLWKPSEEKSYIHGDENKLMQVLSNLLSNAVKYSTKGAQVEISTHHHNHKVRVSITDTGSGIPLDFQNKVFDKFTQADSSDTRRVGGTGLGMAITKTLIEKHGGHIGFESIPGQGATFYFDLPMVKNSN